MFNIKGLLPLILLEAIPLKMCKKWENNASRRWPKKDGAKVIVNKSCRLCISGIVSTYLVFTWYHVPHKSKSYHLLTIKLSCLQKNKFGHTMHGLLLHIFGGSKNQYKHTFKKISKFLGICSPLGKTICINSLYPWFWNSTTNIAITSFQEKIPKKLNESKQYIFS